MTRTTLRPPSLLSFRPVGSQLRRPRTVVVAAGLALLLSSCGSSDAETPAPTSNPTTSSPSSDATAGTQAEALTLVDPWVKAADAGMTGAFGTLTNSGDSDVRVLAATTAGARLELHEMAPGADGTLVMTETEDGFVVPAHGTRVLEPGGEHIMFMDMTEAVEAGAEVELVLELEDGSTVTVTAPGRTFAGANESYHGSDDEPSDADHDG